MPKWKIKLKGQAPFFKEAEHVAYEGPAVVLYDEFPYDPTYVIINWEAQIVRADDE